MAKDNGVTQSIKTRYASFKELKDHLTSVPRSKITKATFFIDKSTLKPVTYDSLLKMVEAHRKRLGTEDFRTVGRIRGHISFRERNNGFKYRSNTKKGTIQLIGIISQ